MPRDNAAKFVPNFSINPQRLYQRLAEVKASGSAYAVIGCLLAYDFRASGFAWPTQETIVSWFDGNYSLRTIQTAIKFLEDNGFLKRVGTRKRQRYALFVDRPSAKTSSQSSAKTSAPKEEKEKSKTSTPKPPTRGQYKQRRERRQRRPRYAAAPASPPVKTEQEQALERRRMLLNGLNWIAVGAGSVGVPKEDYGLLLPLVEDWWERLTDKERKVYRVETREDLDRVRKECEKLQSTP